MSEFTERFTAILTANGMKELATFAERFEMLTVRMNEVNSYMNLTAITETDDVILKHYVDSFTLSAFLPTGATLLDIGCGAGFPSVPIAIIRPDVTVTAVDSTAKRIRYITETAELLQISNINAVVSRAEELPSSFCERFDVVSARAVARLNVLAELCMPYVRIGGRFVPMKANFTDELQEAANAVRLLGGQLVKAHSRTIALPHGEAQPRALLEIRKISHTPKNYPRNNAQIQKKPL